MLLGYCREHATRRVAHRRHARAGALLLRFVFLLAARQVVLADKRAVADRRYQVVLQVIRVRDAAQLHHRLRQPGQVLLQLLHLLLEIDTKQPADAAPHRTIGGGPRIEQSDRDALAASSECRVTGQLAAAARERNLFRQIAEVPGAHLIALDPARPWQKSVERPARAAPAMQRGRAPSPVRARRRPPRGSSCADAAAPLHAPTHLLRSGHQRRAARSARAPQPAKRRLFLLSPLALSPLSFLSPLSLLSHSIRNAVTFSGAGTRCLRICFGSALK